MLLMRSTNRKVAKKMQSRLRERTEQTLMLLGPEQTQWNIRGLVFTPSEMKRISLRLKGGLSQITYQIILAEGLSVESKQAMSASRGKARSLERRLRKAVPDGPAILVGVKRSVRFQIYFKDGMVARVCESPSPGNPNRQCWPPHNIANKMSTCEKQEKSSNRCTRRMDTEVYDLSPGGDRGFGVFQKR